MQGGSESELKQVSESDCTNTSIDSLSSTANSGKICWGLDCMAKILLIEDDKTIADSLVELMTNENHTVEWAENGTEGYDRLRLYQYDLVVLDWGLPGMNGLDLCRAYRQGGGKLPLLMLTARDAEHDKEAGLDTGADDYLTKPFGAKEFKARVRALLRRPVNQFENVSELRIGNVCLTLSSGSLTINGESISLQRRELLLLDFLMRNSPHLFTAQALLDRVWSAESDASPAALRQCITRLRKKIEVPGSNCRVSSVYGLGYRLEESTTSQDFDAE